MEFGVPVTDIAFWFIWYHKIILEFGSCLKNPFHTLLVSQNHGPTVISIFEDFIKVHVCESLLG